MRICDLLSAEDVSDATLFSEQTTDEEVDALAMKDMADIMPFKAQILRMGKMARRLAPSMGIDAADAAATIMFAAINRALKHKFGDEPFEIKVGEEWQ